MKILQWSMTIPKDKQEDFLKYSNNFLGSTWKKFGCVHYELYKVNDQSIIGRLTLEKDRFIEQLSFEDNIDFPGFFNKVKTDPEAYKISRAYENIFGAKDIQLRILNSQV